MKKTAIDGKPTFAAATRTLESLGDAADAKFLQRYFKTGPGEYGAGDVFRGIRVPEIRALVRPLAAMPLADVQGLLMSRFHEDRLLALLLLVHRFEHGDEAERRRVHALYLKNTRRINNWDLVDLSAWEIVGAWAAEHGTEVLERFVKSPLLWERRIAIVATYFLIRQKRFDMTLKLSQQLLSDPEDLIHKATGWMLREVGKRDIAVLTDFLKKNATFMPRTALRYAIEKFPEAERRQWLARKDAEHTEKTKNQIAIHLPSMVP
jgi:3-methyladenine DNA glycosylase AlkD